ncbi:ISL3 family transposase [Nocardia brevicatena]|uniref:ISL3 family transposase n=1 Tax=Nocardia brevicatena TaxID=37327 RepID=UPI001C3F2A36|nr:ISL3 family transposase [Nocardia brevicatena]
MIGRVRSEGDAVVVDAVVAASSARCPGCESVSARVHSRYQRRLADAAIAGRMVSVQLTVRRFFCANSDCPAKTFAEQVADLTVKWSRRTNRLTSMLVVIGLALAGRAGARLARRLGLPAGRDTLIRLVRRLPDPPTGPVAVLGVDDFAVRRGHRYGTVMIDLETSRPVDLIDGRDGDALAAWLGARARPRIICRDRAGGYAEGARQGAPDALQVADRFHLWQNLGQAVEKDLSVIRRDLAAALAAQAAAQRSGQAPSVVNHAELKIVGRFRQHHAAVHRLLRQGLSKAAIGRELGLHPATVRKFANAATVDSLIAKNQQRSSILDGYHEHLHRRWNDGIRNAAQLTREIVERGYPGTEQQVQRYLRRFRTGTSQIAVPAPRPPSVRDMTRWIMTDPGNLTRDDTTGLRMLRTRSKDLNRLTNHVQDFAVMMTRLEGHRLDAWIDTAEKDTLPAIASFARNLRRDIGAVRNGLTLPYSSGPVEGHINRIKMIKRQGRANLDLLRKRTLLQN